MSTRSFPSKSRFISRIPLLNTFVVHRKLHINMLLQNPASIFANKEAEFEIFVDIEGKSSTLIMAAMLVSCELNEIGRQMLANLSSLLL